MAFTILCRYIKSVNGYYCETTIVRWVDRKQYIKKANFAIISRNSMM